MVLTVAPFATSVGDAVGTLTLDHINTPDVTLTVQVRAQNLQVGPAVTLSFRVSQLHDHSWIASFQGLNLAGASNFTLNSSAPLDTVAMVLPWDTTPNVQYELVSGTPAGPAAGNEISRGMRLGGDSAHPCVLFFSGCVRVSCGLSDSLLLLWLSVLCSRAGADVRRGWLHPHVHFPPGPRSLSS